jgi:hypothetical protein
MQLHDHKPLRDIAAKMNVAAATIMRILKTHQVATITREEIP